MNQPAMSSTHSGECGGGAPDQPWTRARYRPDEIRVGQSAGLWEMWCLVRVSQAPRYRPLKAPAPTVSFFI